MRRSRVRQKLAANQPVVITKMNTLDPVVCDMIGLLGFDCLWLCNEHSSIDWDRMGHLIRTAAMRDMDVMIRVAKGGYTDLIRPLELGAAGIMVPHCMSGQESHWIGKQTKFQPLGRRALDSGNSDGAYCLIPLADYLKHCNENTFTVVQIEDPEALEQIDAIVAAPGVDGVFVGPGDLSHALGVPGQFQDPRIRDTVEKVAVACKKHGKHWGLPMNAETAPGYIEMGARLLASGADVFALANYFRKLRSDFESIGVSFRANALRP